MKTNDDVVQALGNLTRSDREWILERLSPAARSALVDAPVAAPARPVAQTTAKNDALTAVSVDDVATILKKEPAWMTHLILSQPWSWTGELRERLPESMRQQVAQLNGTGVEYSCVLVDSVLRKLGAALAQGPREISHSRLDRFLSGVGALLSRKRVNARISA